MTLLIDESNKDITLIINSINAGKHGIVHRQILLPILLIDALKEFEDKFNMKYVLLLKEEHYQHIIDVSEVSIGLNVQKLLYSIKVPLFEIDEYKIQHSIPIPKQNGNQFLIAVPKEQFIFLNKPRSMYVPKSEKKISKWKLFKKTKVCQTFSSNISVTVLRH